MLSKIQQYISEIHQFLKTSSAILCALRALNNFEMPTALDE